MELEPSNMIAKFQELLIGRLIAKYRPPMPIVAIVIPHLRANSLKWSFTGSSQVDFLLETNNHCYYMKTPSGISWKFI